MTAVVEDWLELESDPGLFTMLLENIGVKGVQVEDIYDLTEEIKEEVFGFVFLFKWRDESKKNKRSQSATHNSVNENSKFNGMCNLNSSRNVVYETEIEKLNQIYFAHQVIPNSCATNALLSVLMNCTDRINLGPVLNKFRDMTINMTPEKRGLALGNMPELADAHNKRARYLRSDNHHHHHNNSNNNCTSYHSVATALSAPSSRSLFNDNDQDADETYHFVSYLPIGDGLYELDGLQPYPIKHGMINENENWTKLCLNIIRTRMSQKSDHYSLMAVVRDRRKVLAEQLSVLNKNKSVLQQALFQMDQHNSLADSRATTAAVAAEMAAIDGIDIHDGEQQLKLSSLSGAAATAAVVVDPNGGEVSSNTSECSGKFNNRKIRRTSNRVSMRNKQKMEALKKSLDSSISTNDDSQSSDIPNIVLKNEEQIKSKVTALDILKPISIDLTSINNSSIDQISLDNVSNFSISSRSNRNSSKYPTRSSTKRDTLASNSLAYSRSNVSPSQNCDASGLVSNIDFKFPTFSPQQLRHLMQVVDDTIVNCKSKMSDEIEKRKKYITDDMRRNFNYDDFIHAFLFALKKQGLLEKLLEEQRLKLLTKKPTKRPFRSSTTSKRLKLITNQEANLSRKIPKKSLSIRKRGKNPR